MPVVVWKCEFQCLHFSAWCPPGSHMLTLSSLVS